LSYPDALTRRSAVSALGEVGDRSTVPLLVESLKDSDWHVRADAVSALIIIEDTSAVPALITALKDSEKEVRVRAIRALAGMRDTVAVSALIEMLKDSELEVQTQAISALKEIGERSAASALIKLLSDEREDIRADAAGALGKLGDKSVTPLLIKVLKDPSWRVRMNAALALGEIGDKSAIPALVEALIDNHQKARFGAAIALQKMDNKSGVPALIEELYDEWRWSTSDEAAEALAELGEAKGLYEYYYETSDIYVFNKIRKNLIFPASFELLISSTNPFLKSSGYYLMALKAREEGKYNEQLKYADKAFRQINPKNDTALAILSQWLKAQAEIKLNKPRDAQESVQKTEELLAYVSLQERIFYKELFEEYTQFLKGEIYATTGESKAAMRFYDDALEKLETSKKNRF
jgi:HEAT repeat protein/uncharacterized protein YozE (UPF0346 family)